MSGETSDSGSSCNEDEDLSSLCSNDVDAAKALKHNEIKSQLGVELERNQPTDTSREASEVSAEGIRTRDTLDDAGDRQPDSRVLIAEDEIKKELPAEGSRDSTNSPYDQLEALEGINLLQRCLLANIQLKLSASEHEESTAGLGSDTPPTPKEAPPPSSSRRRLRERKRAAYDISHPSNAELELCAKALTHSGAKRFKCSDCDKEFKSRGDLRSHSIKHSTARPFKCEICDSAFKSKSTLASHVAIHATVKPFGCEKCGETFATKEKVRQHSLCHLTERAFKCLECDSEFKRKGDLKRHQDVHSSKRAFPCPDCGVSFKRKGSLKKHSIVHLDEDTLRLLDRELEYHLS